MRARKERNQREIRIWGVAADQRREGAADRKSERTADERGSKAVVGTEHPDAVEAHRDSAMTLLKGGKKGHH